MKSPCFPGEGGSEEQSQRSRHPPDLRTVCLVLLSVGQQRGQGAKERHDSLRQLFLVPACLPPHLGNAGSALLSAAACCRRSWRGWWQRAGSSVLGSGHGEAGAEEGLTAARLSPLMADTGDRSAEALSLSLCTEGITHSVFHRWTKGWLSTAGFCF